MYRSRNITLPPSITTYVRESLTVGVLLIRFEKHTNIILKCCHCKLLFLGSLCGSNYVEISFECSTEGKQETEFNFTMDTDKKGNIWLSFYEIIVY